MSMNFQPISKTDFGGGIDQQSSEDKIADGFIEDALNMDPSPQGFLSKRKGYQGYGGNLPLRVVSVQADALSAFNLCFTLDAAVDLGRIRSTPIVVQGRRNSTDTSGKDFVVNQDTVRYYDRFTANPRELVIVGANTLNFDAGQSQMSNANFIAGISRSSDAILFDNSVLYPDSITINESTFATAIALQNNATPFNSLVYFKSKTPAAGSVYVHSQSNAGAVSSIAIAAGTHGLSNFNVGVSVYGSAGGSRTLINPDSISISVSGTVTIGFSPDIPAATFSTIECILTALDLTQSTTGTIGLAETKTIALSAPTSPFVFVYCFLENGSAFEIALPDSISVDDSTDIVSVTFTNNSGSAANFKIFYEYGSLFVNQLCVAAQAGTYSDTAPQLTIWGLDHSEIYAADAGARAGWANLIDTYRAAAEEFAIAGLGGNLFREALYSSAADRAAYNLPLLYPNIRQRIDTTKYLGPTFVWTSDSSLRSRGYYKFDTAGEGNARAVSISFDAGVGSLGSTKYILDCPNLDTANATLSTVSTTAGLEDWLTVSSAGHEQFNGFFKILQFQANAPAANQITVWVENSAVDSSDFDETDSGALAGIFTDRVTLAAGANPFLPDDYIFNESLDTLDIQCISALGSDMVLGEIFEQLQMPAGQRIVGRRTSDILPLRDSLEAASVTNLVRGDMASLDGYARLLRIKSINPSADDNVTIAGDGATATISSIADTSIYFVGQRLQLRQAGAYTGAIAIASIASATSITFESSETASETGIISGYTVELDESLQIEDTIDSAAFLFVPQRWAPVEAPESANETSTEWLPKKTYIQNVSTSAYDEQPLLRSSKASDNVYITDIDSQTMKYDGASVYRAGLPRWQAGLFVTKDTASSATISAPTTKYDTVSGVLGNNYVTATSATTAAGFSAGDSVAIAGISDRRFIVSTTVSDKVYFTSALPSAVTGQLMTAAHAVIRYYCRLNAVDANDNVIMSATVNSDDLTTELDGAAKIRMRLVGFPAWDNYEFDRVELEVYRTLVSLNGAGAFHKIITKSLSFKDWEGYIDIEDSSSDDKLAPNEFANLDERITAIKGESLANDISHPLPAKYTTSAGNRLVLANFQGAPQLDIKLSPADTADASITTLLTGKRFLFRKDSADTATTTNNTSRMAFEFVTGDTGVTGISAASPNITITAANSFVAGDWVYLFRKTAPATLLRTEFMGWHQVVSATGADFVIKETTSLSGALGVTNYIDQYARATAGADVPVYLGTSDYNYGQRNLSFGLLYQLRKLANAVNSAMRVCSPALSSGFVPWMMARGGGDADSNQILIEQPKNFSTSMEVLLPTLAGADMYVNGIRRDSASQAGSFTAQFPSRLIASYANYPESFDSPTNPNAAQSDSAIDVNSADGQEITGIIPFFGDSAFGAALKSGVIVVFKTSSIYVVDLAAKDATPPQNPVQKIESQGLGCTAPASIASTRNGIMFANESGIFRLTRNLEVEYVGQKLDRMWLKDVNKEQLALAQGHHYALGRLYKLSFPIADSAQNSDVFVYNHTREYASQGFGSWTRYDSHPATGWANLAGVDSLFCTTSGRVFSIRRTGDDTDFRDDSSAIVCSADLKSEDLGLDISRKKLGGLMLYFRSPETISMENSSVSFAIDLRNTFIPMSSFRLIANAPSSDGLSDSLGSKVSGLLFSASNHYFTWGQIRVTNSGKDERFELVRAVFLAAPYSASKGIKQAAQTLS